MLFEIPAVQSCLLRLSQVTMLRSKSRFDFLNLAGDTSVTQRARYLNTGAQDLSVVLTSCISSQRGWERENTLITASRPRGKKTRPTKPPRET